MYSRLTLLSVASVSKEKFCTLLRVMHRDETKAFPEYTKLIDAGYLGGITMNDVEKLGNNRFDEKRHKAIIGGIIKRHCR